MDIWQFEVGEVLLSLPEVLHHGIHEQFVLLLQAFMYLFQVSLELVKVWWHLPYDNLLAKVRIYLKHSQAGSQAEA